MRRADEILRRRGLLSDTNDNKPEAVEEEKKEESTSEPVKNETYELPKTLQEKIENTNTGPLSWYKG